jgi:hypothetical protein
MGRLIARTALIVVACLALILPDCLSGTLYLGSFTEARFEATPVTPMAFLFGSLFTSFVLILVGNLLLNRYFKRHA